MLIHIDSNTVFANRKQAIKCMGRYKYLKDLKECKFRFINDEK